MNVGEADQEIALLVPDHMCRVRGMPGWDVGGWLERCGVGLEGVNRKEGGLKSGMGGELHGSGSVEKGRLEGAWLVIRGRDSAEK